MNGITGEYIDKGIAKLRQGTPCGVAAIFAGEVSANDLDGARWRFVVVGQKVAIVEGTLAGTYGGSPGMPVDTADLEAQVERLAGNFDRDSRVEEMAAVSPLRLFRDRLAA